MTCLSEEAPANSVPAAAVRREGRVLFGMIGRTAHVGGPVCCFFTQGPRQLGVKASRTVRSASKTVGLEFYRGKWNARWRGYM